LDCLSSILAVNAYTHTHLQSYVMAASTIIPVVYNQQSSSKDLGGLGNISASNRYSVLDHGQGYRTYSYEFDLIDYEPEQIVVLLDEYGTLRIRASRPPCHEFKREFNLGGSTIETKLVRNTIDTHGRLRVDIDIRPKRHELVQTTNNILRFDLQGYRPENVTVRINRKGLLKIAGQHIDNSADNRINREYYRQYQLSSNIDPDRVRARMDENNILTIELPPGSSTQQYTQGEYWIPVRDRPYAPFYGTTPYAGYCCCNLM
jgi:HSP20 family molecular chaperone IbpA